MYCKLCESNVLMSLFAAVCGIVRFLTMPTISGSSAYPLVLHPTILVEGRLMSDVLHINAEYMLTFMRLG